MVKGRKFLFKNIFNVSVFKDDRMFLSQTFHASKIRVKVIILTALTFFLLFPWAFRGQLRKGTSGRKGKVEK